MRINQAFKLAWQSILGSKMRSFLTMLGMIIGVGSVITLLGLMQGATNYLIDTFSEMGTNELTVTVTNTDSRRVDVDEMYQLAEDNSRIFEGVTPKITSSYTAKYGSTSMTTSVNGVGENYMALNNLTMSSGRFISYADIKNRYNACVIGTYVNQELFGGNVKLGDNIRINGDVYKVVGIQQEQAGTEEGSTDDCIYIAYSNATRLAGSADISKYTFVTKDQSYVTAAEKVLDNYLYNIFKDEDLYRISTSAKLLDTINSITSILSSVLGGIAGISLLVAGIGIMNIMMLGSN